MEGDGEDCMPVFQPSQNYSHEYSGSRRQKVFNDSVHGHFMLHRASVAFIDTPQFQRLRNLKQLGLAYKIFPSASHNRFEHSLGVAHLASDWGHHLLNSRDGVGEDGWQLRRLEPEDRQHLAVLQLAGLTHDLGHGPFSHVFEKELLPRLGLHADVVKDWEHEQMSTKIFDHILDDADNGIDLQELAHLDATHIRLIKQLMHGSRNPAAEYAAAPWLFDIVANKRNGIDCDKFDYLARDASACAVPVHLDMSRVMMFSRLSPAKDMVVFKQTEYSTLAVGVFQSRVEMHRRVYTHKKTKSVEFMVCDALALAAEPLGLREAVAGDSADLQAYINLDDGILQRVKLLVPEHYERPGDVLKAQALIAQMERRHMYKYVSEVTLDIVAQQKYAEGSLKPTAEDIVRHQSTADSQVRLNPDNVIVCEIHIDQGMKGQNPMNNVRFYQTSDPEGGDEPFAMPQEHVTNMFGTVYQDKIIRVYSKDSSPAVCQALKAAFTAWCKAIHGRVPPGTPWRGPGQPPPLPPSGAPPSMDRLGGAAGLVQNMFRAASDANANGNGNGLANGSNSGSEQHMGSGRRSRKRSLHPEMAAASSGSQQADGGGSQGGASGGSSSSQGRLKVGRVGGGSLPDIAEEQ